MLYCNIDSPLCPQPLPECWRNISGFHHLPQEDLTAHGWLPVTEDDRTPPPGQIEIDRQYSIDGATVRETKIFGDPPPDWLNLYRDLEDSPLLTRIVMDSIDYPAIATPLQLLTILITTTRRSENLQGRLDLVVNVLSQVGRGLTTEERDWLNDRLQARGFEARVLPGG